MLELFREAIAAQPDPELVAIYFKQLTDYYKDDGEGSPEEIIAEYDRLSPVFDGATGQAAEYKDQFDKCFGLSGVASCENLEAMIRKKTPASNNDPDVLAQAVDLMTRAKCDSEFYLTTAEKYYEVKPSAETALFLAQAFQNKQEYDKAIKYLTERWPSRPTMSRRRSCWCASASYSWLRRTMPRPARPRSKRRRSIPRTA